MGKHTPHAFGLANMYALDPASGLAPFNHRSERESVPNSEDNHISSQARVILRELF
jgi:hypothetical protein